MPEQEHPATYDAEAAQAVIQHAKDIFNFESAVETTEPTRVQVQSLELSQNATKLVGHYLDKAPRVVTKKWQREGQITLPTVEIDGTPFQFSAYRNPEDESTKFSLSRPDQVMSGFSILQKGELAFFLVDSDKTTALSEESEELLAIKEARKWLASYAAEIGVRKRWHKLEPRSPVLSSEVSAAQRTRRRIAGVAITAGAITIATIMGGTVGIKSYLDAKTNQRIEFDNTHFLPENATPIRVGETKAVALGDSLDIETITNAELVYGDASWGDGLASDAYLDASSDQLIRSTPNFGLAKNIPNADNCTAIALKDVGDNPVVKVATIKKSSADRLTATLNRTEVIICNTDPINDVDLSERELFIEVSSTH